MLVEDYDMRYNVGKAFIYAVLLWLLGSFWGSIVFMTPAFKQ